MIITINIQDAPTLVLFVAQGATWYDGDDVALIRRCNGNGYSGLHDKCNLRDN
jgi:hypothetical protein